MTDIFKHKFSDEGLELNYHDSEHLLFSTHITNSIKLTKQDAIAIAKHFKQYRDIESINNIVDQLKWWLKRSGAKSEDDHVIPPMWQSKGQIENWIKVLEGHEEIASQDESNKSNWYDIPYTEIKEPIKDYPFNFKPNVETDTKITYRYCWPSCDLVEVK